MRCSSVDCRHLLFIFLVLYKFCEFTCHDTGSPIMLEETITKLRIIYTWWTPNTAKNVIRVSLREKSKIKVKQKWKLRYFTELKRYFRTSILFSANIFSANKKDSSKVYSWQQALSRDKVTKLKANLRIISLKLNIVAWLFKLISKWY